MFCIGRCQATKPAVLLVTMHKFPGGIHTAVNIHDGCFGTTTVMRIASMFVPTNIFQVRAVLLSMTYEITHFS